MKAGALEFLPKRVCESLLPAAVKRVLQQACVEFAERRERADVEQRFSRLTRLARKGGSRAADEQTPTV